MTLAKQKMSALAYAAASESPSSQPSQVALVAQSFAQPRGFRSVARDHEMEPWVARARQLERVG